MKLLQLNAWGGRLESQVGDLLKAERPDILCLQEVISFQKNGSGLFITLEKIQDVTGLAYMAFAPVFSFNYMHGTARFGNCILSRFPIKKSEVVFTYLEHEDNFMWNDRVANMRNFVHAVIKVDGQLCNVITHHGFWVPAHKNGTPETTKQMKQLADYIQNLEGPIILTGDFNLVPESKSLVELSQLLTNLTLTHKLKTTRTELTFKTEACDYIFVNDRIKVNKFSPLEKIVSDHKALVLECEL